MRMVIAAGGTGGHFYPGLAVAQALRERGDHVEFIVRRNDYVAPLLERENFGQKEIFASGLNRSLHPKNIRALFKLAIGTLQCFFYFLKRRPQAVLVMGGYLSVPAALAAHRLKIPVLLHEQNVTPGLANQLLGRLASRVALSFEASRPFFKRAAVLTGNPVRIE